MAFNPESKGPISFAGTIYAGGEKLEIVDESLSTKEFTFLLETLNQKEKAGSIEFSLAFVDESKREPRQKTRDIPENK